MNWERSFHGAKWSSIDYVRDLWCLAAAEPVLNTTSPPRLGSIAPKLEHTLCIRIDERSIR
jgi:hypothetical protein